MIFLPKCAAALAALCADEQARYAMTGVHVSALPGERWRLEASDGKALAILRGASAPGEQDRALAQGLPEPQTLLTSAVVPAREFSDLIKAIPKPPRGQSGTRKACILLGRPEVILAAGERVARTHPIEGRFPDCDVILPKKPALFSVVVNPDLLIRVLKAASVVSASRGEAPQVEILFFARDKPIGVITQGDDVVFDALVMPLT